jgi:putative transposase
LSVTLRRFIGGVNANETFYVDKGVWLKPKHLMRWHTSDTLHAHTADACVQAFFASLKSWRTRRKTDPDAHPPRRRRSYFRIEYKSTAMRHKDGQLPLSNGKGNAPLVLDWSWETPKTVVIHWTGTQYEAIATYKIEAQGQSQGNKVAGIDLGEIHMAVSHDGTETHLLNGRLLRSKRQYQNKLKAKLSTMIDVKKKGSRRRKKLIRSKQKQIKRLQQQVNDIEHKQSSRLISILHANGVQTVVIGDVRDIRQDFDVGSKNNQKLHQWSHGSIRHKLTGHRQNGEGWMLPCKMSTILLVPALCVSMCGKARCKDGCFGALHATGHSIAMELELSTFDESIWVHSQ